MTLDDEIPSRTNLIITSVSEAPDIEKKLKGAPKKKPRILKLQGKRGLDLNDQLTRALTLLFVGKWNRVILGVDPGIRFGLAILVGGHVVDKMEVIGSEQAAERAYQLLHPYLADPILVRVGNGTPVLASMFIRSLLQKSGLGVEVQLVDESKSSVLGRMEQRSSVHMDQAAAVVIAQTRGTPIDPMTWSPPIQDHNIRHVQQMIQTLAGRELHLPREVVEKVARGIYSVSQVMESIKENEW